MIRLPIAILSAVVSLAIVGYFVLSGSSTPQISQDVTSVPGDGAKADSLYHADALNKALATFKTKFGAEATMSSLKIEPNSLKATTSQGEAIVGKHGETEALGTGGIDATGGQAGFTISRVDSTVPAKIVSALASKGVSLANINYFLVQTTFDGNATKPGWLVYSTKGDFEAHYDGTHVKPLGSGSVTTITSGSVSGATSQAQKAAKGAESEAACIQAAGTDPAKITACTAGK